MMDWASIIRELGGGARAVAEAGMAFIIWRLWGRKPAAAASVHAAALMEDAPLSVEDHTPVLHLLETLSQHSVPFVAVLRQGKLVGILTRTDVMRILMELAL